MNLKLNLGCGDNKLNDFINIDVEKSLKPDLVLDFIKEPLPYENETVDKIVMFHTIEHIQKRYHSKILQEIWRVLIPAGKVLISYPEFTKCYANWATNYLGKKDFWEATMFGRQLYPSDHHVCIMDSAEFHQVLTLHGFRNISTVSETFESYNSVIGCKKGDYKLIQYEDLIRTDMEQTIILQ